jgi:signal transduction histidine kinase
VTKAAEKPLTPERELTDESLRVEREKADDAIGEPPPALAEERGETDEDLSLERARSDRSVATRDEFLGVVSHDLTNMLSAMVGFAALIVKADAQPGREADVAGYAQRIQRSGARMKRLIGDLVDVASIEVGRLAVTREVGDAAAVVNEAVEALQPQATASGVSLAVEMVQPLPSLPFDAARLFQVLFNLVSNALKFTPHGGKVVVRVERIGPDLRFSIRDTGVGVPADRLKVVFDRFVQVHDDRRGMGLGLYIAKCIVEGHDGKIWAESKTGEGSTFCFTIPVEVEAAA